MAIRVQEAASLRLDEIDSYTRDRWGEAQAVTAIIGLFAAFEQIETRGVASRPVPAEFDVDGYFFRCMRHVLCWRRLGKGDIGIVTILHERVRQMARFGEDCFSQVIENICHWLLLAKLPEVEKVGRQARPFAKLGIYGIVIIG
jgi:plasmid stabilization system protein ParE